MAEYTDLIMVIGAVLMFLSFPSFVGAFSRSDPPRMGILALFMGGALVVYANASRPGGYSLAEMPDLFLRVLTGA